MKKFILSAVILTIVMAACTDSKKYTLTGHLSDSRYNGKTIYMYDHPRINMGSVVDSAVVNNGTFTFTGTAPDTISVRAIFLDREMGTPYAFVVEEGNTEMAFDAGNKETTLTGGGEATQSYQQFQDSINALYDDLSKLKKEKQALEKKGNFGLTEFKEWKAKTKNISDEAEDIIFAFVQRNSQNQLGEYVFDTNGYFMAPDKQLILMSGFRERYKNSERNALKKKYMDNSIATANGRPYRDIKGFDWNKNTVVLSDYVEKGNVVLVDFWSSWSDTHQQDLSQLKELYNKYKDKGLTIVGVSLDVSLYNWKEAAEEGGMDWPQLSNLKGWDEDGAVTYGVRFIPRMILIGKNGYILENNITVDELKYKLEEIL